MAADRTRRRQWPKEAMAGYWTALRKMHDSSTRSPDRRCSLNGLPMQGFSSSSLTGQFEYFMTQEYLKDLLSTSALLSSRSISKDRSNDEIVPVEDALMFAASIPNHELHIIIEANLRYTGHEKELTTLVLDLIKSQPHFPSSLCLNCTDTCQFHIW